MVDKNIEISRKYNIHATEYDKLSREAIPWIFFDQPFLLKKIIPSLDKNSKILDFGCGSGKAIDVLIKKGFSSHNITGIDISKNLVDIAKANLPEVKFHVGDFTKFILPENSFDVVFSIRSLEYLNEKELKKVFLNVFQSLKKGGHFFIVTGHPLRVNDKDISKYLERGLRKVSLPWGTKVNLYHKTLGDFINTAVESGFSIELVDEPTIPLSLKKQDAKRYSYYKSYGATNLNIILKK